MSAALNCYTSRGEVGRKRRKMRPRARKLHAVCPYCHVECGQPVFLDRHKEGRHPERVRAERLARAQTEAVLIEAAAAIGITLH